MHRPRLESLEHGPHPSDESDTAHAAETILGFLSLAPDQIDAPAFFVDDGLSVRWAASGGTDPFSEALARELHTAASRNVFNLLLRPSIKHAIADWRSFFAFVYDRLHNTAPGAWRPVAEGPLAGRTPFFSPEDEQPVDRTNRSTLIDSCPIGTDDPPAHRLFSMTFDKGTLFVLRRDRRIPKATMSPLKAPMKALPSADTQKRAICVLSARLNHAHDLAKGMLPDLFMKIMSRVWDDADGIVRSLGGKRVSCNGPRLCYAFFRNASRDPIFSAICCATRLNPQMVLLEEKLRAQYGWSDEIRLNMGIGHGTDVQTGSGSMPSSALVIPGGAFEQASLLSGIAGKGETWITQEAAARLPAELIDQVVLGACHQGQFSRNFFRRIADIQATASGIAADPEMQALTVAQIIKTERTIR